ncbi:MAG: proton-conducting transporter membrane subunit [Kosmotogaceae bacterium]
METIVNPVSFLILLPIITALINTVVPVKFGKWFNFLACIVLLGSLVAFYGIVPESVRIGEIISLSMDGFAYFSLLFVQILSVIFSIYLLGNDKKRIAIYFMISLAFINGALVAIEPIPFIVFWGLSGLMLYLFGITKKEGVSSSKKALMLSGISDSLLIFGFFMIAKVMGDSFSIFNLQPELNNGWTITAFIFIAFAAFSKAGAFPMHIWVPSYCEKTSIEGTFVLPASFDKILGIYLFARLMWNAKLIPGSLQIIFALLGAFTIIAGVMMALIQHNGRKLLGYHAVSQVGYMVLGIATGNPLGIIGGMLHTVNNATYKSGLFMGLGNVEQSVETTDLDKLGGLSKKMPGTFWGMLINSVSISGLPPTNGFISKWLIYNGLILAIARGTFSTQLILTICLIMALFGSALTFASFMKLTYSVFLGKSFRKTEEMNKVKKAPTIALLINASLCIFIGIAWKFFPVGMLNDIFGGSILSYEGYFSITQYLGVVALVAVSGTLIYFVFKRVRFDSAYVGGQPDSPTFKVSGVSFFNEIKDMVPLKGIYRAAENKWLDIYELSKSAIMRLSYPLKKLHTGELSFYSLWITIGFIVLLVVLM